MTSAAPPATPQMYRRGFSFFNSELKVRKKNKKWPLSSYVQMYVSTVLLWQQHIKNTARKEQPGARPALANWADECNPTRESF